jgi:hypothetical protein
MFRNINLLASHKLDSYNGFHWLSLLGNLRMSPPPSSLGGLSPNSAFGLFFVRAFSSAARRRGSLPPAASPSQDSARTPRKPRFPPPLRAVPEIFDLLVEFPL